MKTRKHWIFAIFLCLLISIELVACNDTPAAQSGTLKSKNGVTVEGTFADGAALEAVEVVGADKILALQSIAEEKYDTDGEVYVYDISLIKDGAKVRPSGKVKVTVSVPDIDTSKTYTVYHVKQDGAVDKIKPTVQSGSEAKALFRQDKRKSPSRSPRGFGDAWSAADRKRHPLRGTLVGGGSATARGSETLQGRNAAEFFDQCLAVTLVERLA